MIAPVSALSGPWVSPTAADLPLATGLADVDGCRWESIQAELTARGWAEHGERRLTRTNHRDEHRDELVSTRLAISPSTTRTVDLTGLRQPGAHGREHAYFDATRLLPAWSTVRGD